MTNMSSCILMLGLAVSTILAGCSSTENNEDIVTQSIEASDFALEVTTPTVIATGAAIKIKGTLKYTGVKPVEVSHGEPIIRFFFSGSNEERSYTDKGYVTVFKSGQIVEIEDEFIAAKKGKQNLFVNIEGFSFKDISLTMNPIEIFVN